MTDFLSDEWIAALDAKLQASGKGSAPETLIVQYAIATDDAVVSYHLILGPDTDRAFPGTSDDAHVTFQMDEPVASRISTGELSTEEAFITGELHIEGDPMPLLEAHRTATDA